MLSDCYSVLTFLEQVVVDNETLKSIASDIFHNNEKLDFVYAASCCRRTSVMESVPQICGKCSKPVFEYWRVNREGLVERLTA